MTLRKKTLLITGFMIAGMVLTVFIIAQFVILQSYINLDTDAATQNTQRVVNAFNNRLHTMKKVIIDWAVWDDAYQYASDGNTDFVDNNITADAFDQLEIDVMLIIDKSGKVLNVSGFNLETGEPVTVPNNIIQTLSHNSLLMAVDMDTQTKSGIVDLDGQKMMVASAAILKGNFDGPPNGTIIQARYLDKAETDYLSNTIGLPVSVYDYNASDLPADVLTAKNGLSASMPLFVQTLGDNAQSGYAILNNIQDAPDVIIRIDMPRSVYQQGKQTLSYFVILVIILGLVFGGAILYVLEASVLARMAGLSKTVVEISDSNDLHRRVVQSGQDEISRLESVINKLLSSTENSQIELKHRLEELAILQNQKDRFFSHAAHEFRTPLANFRTHLYLARKRPDRAEEYLTVLEKVTRQMTDLVEDIFDVARYGEHSIELHELFTSLGQLLKEICDDQRPFAITKGIDWQESLPSETLNVMVDNARITQALSKIMNYVISFTPPSSKVEISLNQVHDHAVIHIGSSMMNVRREQAVQIFQPFFRTSEGSTVTTGLGLTIAKEIIERHGGRIRFEPNDEKGGTFIIELLLMNEVDDASKQRILQNTQ